MRQIRPSARKVRTAFTVVTRAIRKGRPHPAAGPADGPTAVRLLLRLEMIEGRSNELPIEPCRCKCVRSRCVEQRVQSVAWCGWIDLEHPRCRQRVDELGGHALSSIAVPGMGKKVQRFAFLKWRANALPVSFTRRFHIARTPILIALLIFGVSQVNHEINPCWSTTGTAKGGIREKASPGPGGPDWIRTNEFQFPK
jgi:hypothetical protein